MSEKVGLCQPYCLNVGLFSERIMDRIYGKKKKKKSLGDYLLIIHPSAINHSLRTQPDTHLFLLLQVLPPSAEKGCQDLW